MYACVLFSVCVCVPLALLYDRGLDRQETLNVWGHTCLSEDIDYAVLGRMTSDL